MKSLLPVLTLLAAAPARLPAQTHFDLQEVAWVMRPDPGGASIAVEMQLAPLFQRQRLMLRVPWWRPGSYRYARYEQSLSHLRAEDQEGRGRPMTQLDPRTWEVDVSGATALTVRYDLAVQNDADPDAPVPAIHLHGPASFLYLEDALPLPQLLRFELPAGWSAASGHRPDPQREGWFRSPNYDVFVDCPIALGGLERHDFTCRGKPIEVVIFGRAVAEAEFPRAEWLRKVEAICNAAYDVVGDFPFEKYTFLFDFNEIGGGYGLEHLNSTTIMYNHRMVRSGETAGLESVTAHEFFHLWNVKRIRPEQLGPFDYSTDVRSRDLWWLEGVTSYYNDVILQRAGLRAEENWFWDAQARNYLNVAAAPGYGKVSAERSSWTVWDPNPGEHISYYDQGQALGLLLDVMIRAETANRRSLDDVVRFLYRWVDYPDRGYRPGDLERAVYAVSGWDCGEFFDRYVSGVVPLPFAEVLGRAGLKVIDGEAGSPYLGLSLGEGLALRVRDDGPAREAGLQDGDLLRRLAGSKLNSAEELRSAIAALQPDSTVEVEVERAGQVIVVSMAVRERTRRVFRIEPDPAATPSQRAIADGLLQGHPQGV